MAKKKKLLKRIAAWFAVAFVLAAGVAPALLPCAGAFGIESEGVDGNYQMPTILSPKVPFDTFTNMSYGITMENPFSKMVGFNSDQSNGLNMPFDITFVPSGDGLYNGGTWTFGSYSQFDNNDGTYNMGLFFDVDSSSNSIWYSFSTSSSFIASMNELYEFFEGCSYVVNPFYQVTSTITIRGWCPKLVYEGGWQLDYFVATSDYFYKNTLSEPINTDAFGYLSLVDVSADFDFDKMLIIDEVIIEFKLYAPLSAAASDKFVGAGRQKFIMPYSSNGFIHTFDEFYKEYPGHRVIVSDNPGAENFDLTTSLKNSVGNFMSTEIIPGLSFGGMLAVAIGLSLVVVFLKFFGG